jgi:TonB family protein
VSRRLAMLGLSFALLFPTTGFARPSSGAIYGSSGEHPDNPTASTQNNAPRIRIPGELQQKSLIHSVAPVYPTDAKAQHVEGTVKLHVIVGKDGTVAKVNEISGPSLLVDAAKVAVKQWVYKPTLLNGEPAEVDTTVTVDFVLDAATNPDPTSTIDPQLKADILHLLQTMKGLEAAESSIRSTFESLRPQLEAALPRTPNREKVIDAYEEKLVALVRRPEFQDGIVAIYAKHLSDQDVKAIDQFYQTEAGQHFVTQLPIIVNESSALGQQAATDGIPRILGELCQEFPELKGQADFCPGDKDKQSQLLPPMELQLLVQSAPAASGGNGRSAAALKLFGIAR